MGRQPDVYEIDEVARAAGVPASVVRALVTSGELRPCVDRRYFPEAEVLRVVPQLRSVAVVAQPLAAPRTLFVEPPSSRERNRFPLLAAAGVHVLLLGAALSLTAGTPQTAPAPDVEKPRLVFFAIPGAGGGGGGSGTRARRPATRVERTTGLRASVAVPATAARSNDATTERPRPQTPSVAPPTEPSPEPLPSRTIIAPVVMTAAQARNREGVVQAPAADVASGGTGAGSRAGDGRGQGSGQGSGSGIADGAGGGFGGGPYRAGNGIQPPRLLHEVKAEFTEDARRSRVSGNVVLEIVVRQDGSVGDMRVVRGLGLGLDERAIEAVRQWRFAPAQRFGQPVDVAVEISVEFRLR